MNVTQSQTDLPVKYRALRESFLKVQRRNAELENYVGKLRNALRHIKEETHDPESQTEATHALREVPDEDLL